MHLGVCEGDGTKHALIRAKTKTTMSSEEQIECQK